MNRAFTGGSQKLGGSTRTETVEKGWTVGESSSEKGIRPVLDPYIPQFMPSEKVTFHKSWKARVTADSNVFDLDQIGWIERMISTLPGKGNLSYPEIHVIWISHVPIDNMRSINLTVNCEFTQTTDPDLKLLGSTIFPIGLHSHSIFKPGHSITLGPGAIIPWAITLDMSDAAISDKYIYGELHICLKAYKTPIGQLSADRGAELISMVPMEEQFTGLSFSRPRQLNKEWDMRSYKLGVTRKGDIEKIFKLQEVGVDVEALMNTKRLKEILKKITISELNNPGEQEFKNAMLKIGTIITAPK
ncbi:TPA_asm: protein 3 [Ribes virus 1]|uniref:Protein 3 n=1 Tax=Ribes virus 1 TaxID=2977985 RepID=A0A9N6YIX9_9RHAB|nr:TPA_asm: protein 3 [Ribes virus 1]